MKLERKEHQESTNPPLLIASVSGSALIAEFMGIKEIKSSFDSYGNQEPIWYCGYLGYRTSAFSVPNKSFDQFLKDAKFRTSWDWLMPVLEKIVKTKIGDGIKYVEYPYLRTFGMVNEETGDVMVRLNGSQLFQSKELFEATYDAIIDFLEWWSSADR